MTSIKNCSCAGDDVTGDAGASGSDYLDPADMERITTDFGRKLRQRTTLYELV